MACCGSKPKAAAGDRSRLGVRLGTADDLGPNTQPDGLRAAVVHTREALPPSLQYWPNGTDRYIRVSKSTYAANNPNEDRCTFAADTEKGYIFAGVWDGHGVFDCPTGRPPQLGVALCPAECRALLLQLVADARNGWTRISLRFF